MNIRKINDPVLTYKMHSEIYRNIQIAAASADLTLDEKLNMLALLRAETFEQMLDVANRFDMNAQFPILHSTVKVCASVLGYFSPGANFFYYMVQLKEDILKFKANMEKSLLDHK